MGKKISGRTGATLGFESSEDFYNKLLWDAKRLQEEWNVGDATNFLTTAWHLFQDWVKSDQKNSMSRLKRNRRKLPVQMNLVLDITRDLVNGSKHFELDQKSTDKRKISEVHDGLEASWFSYLFHEEIAGVTVEGGWYFSIRVLHNILLEYYVWVFDDSQLPTEFPEAILNAIKYCNIRQRVAGSVPSIWAEYE
ncbi:hypothetical protein [Pseudoalteromonas sp. SR41-4]|uniref:hypothetical protein n=1 Tax=Pseudoalteromonas sp. SR41-4 TaxID=2760950 RepID=UPI001602E8DE|nr:hypothetical protein [Pseudoalteromonas sp. SR41-4]MBB1294766.1 hypothetical protein [Pseudoalteromonas sp. SR41-4]|tara:strand:- start:132 stop:713 length:582 start_codon:yes stop_codon:yes gene_type:complete